MAVSQNGYSANDRSMITKYVVTKGGRTMNLRKGSPGLLIAHVVTWFDENIRDIDPGIMDDWSYAERAIRGSRTTSNHASGTAADVDATRWPLGRNPEVYLSAAEIAKLRAHLRTYEGCVRWGGDYTGRKDPMHFEINKGLAECDRVWTKISSGLAIPTPASVHVPAQRQPLDPVGLPVIRKGNRGSGYITLAEKVLKELGYYKGRLDRDFGSGLDRAVRNYQRKHPFCGIADGVIGSRTWASLVHDLKEGDRGPRVELLQNFLGYRPGAGLDSVYGKATTERVRRVQLWGGVAQDGTVGPNTRAVLARA